MLETRDCIRVLPGVQRRSIVGDAHDDRRPTRATMSSEGAMKRAEYPGDHIENGSPVLAHHGEKRQPFSIKGTVIGLNNWPK